MIKSFLRFLINPTIPETESEIHASTFLYVFGSVIIVVVIGFAIRMGLIVILEIVNYSMTENGSFLDKVSPLNIIIFVVFAAPLIEEITFRLPIILTGRNIIFSSIAFFLMIAATSQNAVMGISTLLSPTTILFPFLFATYLFLANHFYKRNIPSRSYIFPFHLFFLNIIFALGHYGLPGNLYEIPQMLANTTPQLISGLFFSFLRLRYGTAMAIYGHFINNAPLALIVLF